MKLAAKAALISRAERGACCCAQLLLAGTGEKRSAQDLRVVRDGGIAYAARLESLQPMCRVAELSECFQVFTERTRCTAKELGPSLMIILI